MTLIDIYPFPFAEDAACSPHNRPDDVSHLFFLVEGESQTEHKAREQAAAAICSGCPVREPCRAVPTRGGARWGIWGGERRTERDGRISITLRSVP